MITDEATNYHAIFGVKFLLALVVFYFTSGLLVEALALHGYEMTCRWLGVTLGLAVAIIMLSDGFGTCTLSESILWFGVRCSP